MKNKDTDRKLEQLAKRLDHIEKMLLDLLHPERLLPDKCKDCDYADVKETECRKRRASLKNKKCMSIEGTLDDPYLDRASKNALKKCKPCLCGGNAVWGAGFLLCDSCDFETGYDNKGSSVREWNEHSKHPDERSQKRGEE